MLYRVLSAHALANKVMRLGLATVGDWLLTERAMLALPEFLQQLWV
jgi:hypothetical protein